MLKDYGYYYPRLQVDKGAEQLKYIKHFHNREEYIKKHRPIVEKYAVDNPVYMEWARRRLECGLDDTNTTSSTPLTNTNRVSFGINI